jgi:cytochrome c-type biogenesis protein CcmH/NrfG
MHGIRRLVARATLGVLIVAGLTASAGAGNGVQSKAEEALALCKIAEPLSRPDSKEVLARALTLAEEAVAADTGDGRAYLAVFCALGKKVKVAGTGFRGLLALRRLHRTIARALELAPDDAEIVAAKGAFLLRVPGALGGSRREGERLLRQALAVQPDNAAARIYLAWALAERGAREEARAEAERVLAAGGEDSAEAMQARSLIAQLNS